MITVDTISDIHSTAERRRHIEQSNMTGRRIWKTVKGRREAVWPPELEASLLEGLRRYHQHKWRPALDRFPMRNRFISDYILETTGKRRTAKQVGSRLQQLKDTCRQERILQFLQSPADVNPRILNANRSVEEKGILVSGSSGHHDVSLVHSLTPVPEVPDAQTFDIGIEGYELQGTVDVCLLLDQYMCNSLPLASAFPDRDFSSPIWIPLISRTHSLSLRSIAHLHNGKDALILLSPCALFLQTTCLVFSNGSDHPVHCEHVSLSYYTSHTGGTNWIYTTSFVPNFWSAFNDTIDLTKYTIHQQITPYCSNLSTDGLAIGTPDPTMLTVVYRFSYSQVDDIRIQL